MARDETDGTATTAGTSDEDLALRAYPDGDPYADRIHVCRACGAAQRTNTSGRPSIGDYTLEALMEPDEVRAEPYDDPDVRCVVCGVIRDQDVYEVWSRDELLERMARREA